jgi:hypothetical protein
MATSMVNVGGTLYRSDQQFEFYSGFGSSEMIDAASAAYLLTSGQLRWIGSNGSWMDPAGDGPGHTLTVSRPILKEE